MTKAHAQGGAHEQDTTAGTNEWEYREVRVRRVYDEAGPGGGVRVLVDRLWPRGLRKDAANIAEWTKEIAPSAQLRTWYGHDPRRFAEFRDRYRTELDTAAGHAALDHLRALSHSAELTLLTATRDVEHSHAAVLADLLRPPS